MGMRVKDFFACLGPLKPRCQNCKHIYRDHCIGEYENFCSKCGCRGYKPKMASKSKPTQ